MKPVFRQYQHISLAITKEGRMTAAFVTGLLAGTFFFNLWGKHYMEELLLYKGLLTGRYEAGGLAGLGLCFYIFRKRGKRFLLLWFMELTEFCVTGRMMYALYYGFCGGVCISSFVFQYGFPGMIYFLLFLFPHFVVYGLMWQVMNRQGQFPNSRRRMILSGMLFLLGIFLEGYVHAGLMQNILQKF